MDWRKQGLIFRPDRTKWWMRSHAALPVPVPLDHGLCRVFFSSRDDHNRSHVGYFDIHLDRPTEILAVSPEPILAPGPPGRFDGDGVYAASAVRRGGELRLYTIGWNRGHPPPMFYAAVGTAISSDLGVSIAVRSTAPIMTRSDFDPSFVSAPYVLRDDGGWRMWYISGGDWTLNQGELASHYDIKHATSDDGLHWHRAGAVCIPATAEEPNISRLWVVPHESGYQAWFGAMRCGRYAIFHVTSPDGLHWIRTSNECALPASQNGWDTATAYPAVVRHKDRWLMFYNGDGFGRDGVGLAIAEAD